MENVFLLSCPVITVFCCKRSTDRKSGGNLWWNSIDLYRAAGFSTAAFQTKSSRWECCTMSSQTAESQ